MHAPACCRQFKDLLPDIDGQGGGGVVNGRGSKSPSQGADIDGRGIGPGPARIR